LRGKSVAVPGPMTTAALLLSIECPEAIPLQVAFDRIPAAIKDGAVEAGVIIHESQLTYAEEGLVKVADFGELWKGRENLPIPLGLDVVRRDLGEQGMRDVSDGFEASIRYALAHEDEALKYALAFGRGLDLDRGRRFVRMYVNDLTLDMGETGRRALERLYELGVKAGAIAQAPSIEVV
jgi:1,4-dihydroxy-6-naphthoate synthase